MNENQRAFLTELAALLQRYHIDLMGAESKGLVVFKSNGQILSFSGYEDGCFEHVASLQENFEVDAQ